jgi:hypothetical protein
MQLRDTSAYQGLKMFRVERSLPAKSSSYVDTERELIEKMLEGKFYLGSTEIAILLDTEFILTFFHFVFLDHAQRLKNIFILPPFFHGRAHVLKNLTNDPVHMLLIVLPYYYALELQREKMRAKLTSILAMMTAYIRKC